MRCNTGRQVQYRGIRCNGAIRCNTGDNRYRASSEVDEFIIYGIRGGPLICISNERLVSKCYMWVQNKCATQEHLLINAEPGNVLEVTTPISFEAHRRPRLQVLTQVGGADGARALLPLAAVGTRGPKARKRPQPPTDYRTTRWGCGPTRTDVRVRQTASPKA